MSINSVKGFSPIRFVAEYPTHGFGITRLTPIYDDSFPFEPSSEALWIDAAKPDSSSIHSWNQPSLSEPEEHPDSDEALSRLPRWIKVLNEIRRKARQASSE